MAYVVWHLGAKVAEFATREGALGYTQGHLSDYADYEITDESDAL
jgi:hypothetical protein